MRPSKRFLKPAIAVPFPMKEVERRVPSTAQIFVSGLVVICRSTLLGAVKVFSRGVCNHQCFPLRTREGLRISNPLGRSRESVWTLPPGPARAGPDLEQDGVSSALFPLSRVKGNRLVPGAWGNGGPLTKWLLLPLASWPSFVL